MVRKRDLLGSSVSMFLDNYRMMIHIDGGFCFGIVDKDTERDLLERYPELECFVEFESVIPNEILKDVDDGVVLEEEDVVKMIEDLGLEVSY